MARKGILGTKLGMTQVYEDDGTVAPVTVIQAGPCTVTQVKTRDRDGYNALQLAFGTRRNVNRPLKGHLDRAGVASARTLAEVRTDDLLDLGTRVTAATFTSGELVDVTGRSKGKGLAGVMKRHNFAGMGDGHGVKKKNRHPGAIGACATPARTFPGQRLPGRMGNQRVTIQNLEVVDVDAERDLILVKGAVPGSNGSVVLLRDAVKAPSDSGWIIPDAEAEAEAEGDTPEDEASDTSPRSETSDTAEADEVGAAPGGEA